MSSARQPRSRVLVGGLSDAEQERYHVTGSVQPLAVTSLDDFACETVSNPPLNSKQTEFFDGPKRCSYFTQTQEMGGLLRPATRPVQYPA